MIQIDSTTQVYFSPQDDTIAEFEKLLNSATKSIYLADYSFNMPQVVTILIDKMKAGLDVKLVLDRSQSAGKSEVPEINQLHAAGVPTVIVESSDHQIMHNKFTIIDGDICQAGSWNYTATAADENNFYFVFNSIDIAQVFEKDFSDMWAGVTTVIKSTITKENS
jgi:phosphatidylserine/phosphatidylglycerophosphate/cardiolipin synthase-like enzyme